MPLALSPDRRFLYAALRSEPFTVVSFAIDPESGRLTPLHSAPLEASMAYTTIDRTGKWLLGRLLSGRQNYRQPDRRGRQGQGAGVPDPDRSPEGALHHGSTPRTSTPTAPCSNRI